MARGGVTEKVGSKAERDVRVMERRAYSRAGRHKDRPQSCEKSDFISFIANEASRYIPGSVLGSSGRSCATSHHSILCRASLCPFTFLLPCRSDALWCGPGQADLVRQACRKVLSCFFFIIFFFCSVKYRYKIGRQVWERNLSPNAVLFPSLAFKIFLTHFSSLVVARGICLLQEK